MENRVDLTPDEIQAIQPTILKINDLKRQINELVQTITPFLTLMAKQKNIEPSMYSLSEDCKAFVLNSMK